MSQPQATHVRATFGWWTLVVALGTLALAAVVWLLSLAGAPMAIVGTALIALGFGGRVVMIVGKLRPAVEQSVAGLCYASAVLGALCFDGLITRVVVAAITLVVFMIVDVVDARVAHTPASN